MTKVNNFAEKSIFFSVYSSVKNKVPTGKATISQVFDEIRGEKFKQKILNLRGLTDDDPGKLREKKQDLKRASLPAWTFQGVFSERDKDHLESHTGLLVIDIDHCGVDKVEGVKKILSNEAVLTFTSPSEDGVKAAFLTNATKETHEQIYISLTSHVKQLTGFTPDPANKDLARACYASWDPGAILNLDAPVFEATTTTINSKPKQEPPKFEPGQRNSFVAYIAASLHRGGTTLEQAKELLSVYERPDFPLSEIHRSIESIYSKSKYAPKPEFDVLAAIEKYKIDFSLPNEPPVIYLKCEDKPIFTQGNISLFSGAAKSRKTFCAACAAAACLNWSGCLKFYGCITGLKVIWIDTEQSPYHARRTVDRIIRMAGTVDNFTAYQLRPLTHAERLAFVEHIAKSVTEPSIIFIDGFRDLLADFNNLDESTAVIEKLLKLSAESPLHVCTVLHNNPGTSKARGHAGTELYNKAETTINIDRDKNQDHVSTVKPLYTRDREFEAFSFTIDETGLPVLTDPKEGVQTRKNAEMREKLKACFPGFVRLTYSDLLREYSERAGVSESTAKRHLKIMIGNGTLLRDSAGVYSFRVSVSDDDDDDDAES